jgi:Sec-independent protein translocase protein TatA
VGLGTEILFMAVLGLLVLGPKQLHTLSRHVARAKVQFEQASRGLKSQLAAELDAAHQERTIEASQESGGISDHPRILGIGTANPRLTQE